MDSLFDQSKLIALAERLIKAARAAGADSADAVAMRSVSQSVDVRDGAVFHSIEVATNPALIGITSTRHIALDGDRLTLSGPDFSPGSGRTQKIVWRRGA